MFEFDGRQDAFIYDPVVIGPLFFPTETTFDVIGGAFGTVTGTFVVGGFSDGGASDIGVTSDLGLESEFGSEPSAVARPAPDAARETAEAPAEARTTAAADAAASDQEVFTGFYIFV